MRQPIDEWAALTTMALQLLTDLNAEHEPVDSRMIVDATIDAFRDLPNVEQYRDRLTGFVHDLIGNNPTHA